MGLHGIERVDVNQADIAPFMSTLLGLPCPVNSVSILPRDYINMTKAEEVEAVLSNTKEILNHFLRKSHIKQSHLLYFKLFKPLSHYSSILDKIEGLILARDYAAAMDLSENLRSLALQGLHYFQTYDWLMLMSVITLGYLFRMIYLALHVLQSYTSLPEKINQDRYCDLSTVQLKLYEQFSGPRAKQEMSSIVTTNESAAAEGSRSSTKASSHVFQALQFLLKLCSHPLLVIGGKIPDSLSTILLELFPVGSDVISKLNTTHNTPQVVSGQQVPVVKTILPSKDSPCGNIFPRERSMVDHNQRDIPSCRGESTIIKSQRQPDNHLSNPL